MRTRSSRTTEDLVELDFTTGRKRSLRTQRVQAEPEVVVTETLDVPEGNGIRLGNGLGRARQPRPIGLGDAPNRHQQRQGFVPHPVQNQVRKATHRVRPRNISQPFTRPTTNPSGHDRSDRTKSGHDPIVRPIVPTDRPNAAVDPKPVLKPVSRIFTARLNPKPPLKT
ncbi:unnamed protein product [Microthlaspi erraticum]|uniref:Uncharacterized protein n=1 Tax=Microthlaspi erraticum TaxID=1685480 RepID=A0A6D2J5F8_9BRAS|nr:unnamed protein product [Microthlaspi erraticum]